MTVTGDAGVGKTRLTRELWDWLADQSPEPLRRTGRCLAYGRGTTYRPLADVLREQLGLRETDAAETVRRRLAGREILGLTLGLDVAPDLHPLAARESCRAAWVALLAELAAERPVVMLVEDLHWAQEPLLDLLERLLDDVEGPLLAASGPRGPSSPRSIRPGAGAATRPRSGWSRSPPAIPSGCWTRCSRTTRPPSCGGPRSTAPRATRSSSRSCSPASRPLPSARDRRPRLGAGGARRPHRPPPADRQGGSPGGRR